MRNVVRSLVVVCLGFVASCGPSPAPVVCVAGRSEACIGPGGCAGGQQCNATGTGYGACDCGGMMVADSGSMTADAGGTDAGGSDAGTDAGTDAGIDAGPLDPGLADGGACDPFSRDAGGSAGCAPGRKCAWITVSEAPAAGQLGCVPNGTSPLNFTCTHGSAGLTTGYDDCLSGSVCIDSTCRRVCDVANMSSCGVDNCVRYSGLYVDANDDAFGGACTEACNPLTQLRTSGMPCPSGQGCYLLTSSTSTTGTCANVGTLMHNEAIPGVAFANTCVPGARARPKADGGSECGGLCAPADVTSSTNQSSEGGVGADSCQTRWGAAAPSDAVAGESCRYYWSAEPFDELSPYSNTVGYCFKHASWLYDSNGDLTPDAPFPRCTTLTTGDLVPPIGNPPHDDALYFYCVAKPPMKRAQPVAPASRLRLDTVELRR